MSTPVDHPDPRIRCAYMAHIIARGIATAETPEEVTERLKLARWYLGAAWRVDRANRRTKGTKCQSTNRRAATKS